MKPNWWMMLVITTIGTVLFWVYLVQGSRKLGREIGYSVFVLYLVAVLYLNLPLTIMPHVSEMSAYQAIFNRRLQRGQSYASLCLGWKEFTPSYFGLFREATKVCTEMPDIRIPSMLRNIFPKGYKSEYQAVYDTDLIIHKGTLVYPERRDVS